MASPHQLTTVTAVDGSDSDMYACNTGDGVTPARTHGHRTDEVSGRRRLHQPQQPHQFTADGVADHVAWQRSSSAFRCTACECQFVSRKYLSMHMALHNVSAVEPPPAADGMSRRRARTGSAPDQWSCPVCDKTFAQNSNFRNHVRTHSDERPYVCLACMIGFKERYHLKKHVLFKHTPGQLDHACRQCGKRFKDLTAVRAHERTHSDARPYGCSRCDKSFKTSECLWHHEHRSKTCARVASSDHGHETKPAAGGQVFSRRHRKRCRTQRCASPSQFESSLSTSESTTPDVATLLSRVVEPSSADASTSSSSAAAGCCASDVHGDSSGVKPETELTELLDCDIGCLWTTSMTSQRRHR